MKHLLSILMLTLCSCQVQFTPEAKKVETDNFIGCEKQTVTGNTESWYCYKEIEVCFFEGWRRMAYVPYTPKVLKFIQECKNEY